MTNLYQYAWQPYPYRGGTVNPYQHAWQPYPYAVHPRRYP